MDSIEMEPQVNTDERRLNALPQDISEEDFGISNVSGADFINIEAGD